MAKKKKPDKGKGKKPDSSKSKGRTGPRPKPKSRDALGTSTKPGDVADGVVQLVRLSGVVVDGNLDVTRAMMKIKGVGARIANSIILTLDIDCHEKVGSLSEEQIDNLEKKIESISGAVPSWMLNRRKDMKTGNDLHLVGSDLDIQKREDINLEGKIKSYRGIRHALNLPVRGQRTKSSFRTGSTIGVSRKKTR